MNNLKDNSVIAYIQNILAKAGIHKSLNEIYNKLLYMGLINKDGSVSQKAIKSGLIRTSNTINQAPKHNTHFVDKILTNKGFTSMKYIDPEYYYNSNKTAKPDKLYHAKIDAYVQQTLQPELNAKITLTKLYISIINSALHYSPNNRDNKFLLEQKSDLEDYIANLTNLHIPDYDDNSIIYDVIFTKIAELKVLPTINNKELKEMVKAHVQLACRNYINNCDDKNKALDGVTRLLHTAKAMRNDIKEIAGF